MEWALMALGSSSVSGVGGVRLRGCVRVCVVCERACTITCARATECSGSDCKVNAIERKRRRRVRHRRRRIASSFVNRRPSSLVPYSLLSSVSRVSSRSVSFRFVRVLGAVSL